MPSNTVDGAARLVKLPVVRDRSDDLKPAELHFTSGCWELEHKASPFFWQEEEPADSQESSQLGGEEGTTDRRHLTWEAAGYLQSNPLVLPAFDTLGLLLLWM